MTTYELFESGQDVVDLALVFLVRVVEQIVCEIFPLDLRISADQLK